MTARRLAAILVAGAACAGITACNDKEEPKVADLDPNLTRPIAQQHVVESLTKTLQSLPAGTTFTRRSPQNASNVLSAGTVVPCDDTDDAGPTDYAVSYFIQPNDPGIYDAVTNAWKGFGWGTREVTGAGQTGIVANAPDGYTFGIQKNQDGNLSINGTSPCFAHPPNGDVSDAPEVIVHP